MLLQKDPFVRAIKDVERALCASHIAAFPVFCCGPNEDLSAVRRKMDRSEADYSHVPVRGPDGRIEAVLFRDGLTASNGPAREHARKIGPEHLVDARESLLTTVERLRRTDFLLVVSPESGHHDGISGIINHADLQKLPVRLLQFAMLSEIEARLRQIVSASDWVARADCADDKAFAEKRARRFDSRLPVEHHLNLSRLGMVAYRLGGFAAGEDGSAVENRLKLLRDVRNTVAHGDDFKNEEVEGPAGTVQAVKEAFVLLDWAFSQLNR